MRLAALAMLLWDRQGIATGPLGCAIGACREGRWAIARGGLLGIGAWLKPLLVGALHGPGVILQEAVLAGQAVLRPMRQLIFAVKRADLRKHLISKACGGCFAQHRRAL